MFMEAETAYGHAITASKEIGDLTSAMVINCNMGVARRKQAKKIRKKKAAYRQAVEAATEEYTKSTKFFKAAVNDPQLAIEKGIVVPEFLKVDVYTHLGNAYLRLGMFLSEENTIAKSAHGLKSVSDPSPGPCLLSASEALLEAIAVYEELGLNEETACIYDKLGEHHKARFFEAEREGRRGEAEEQAFLADENWQKSKEIFCTEKSHNEFLKILIKRSDLFNLP